MHSSLLIDGHIAGVLDLLIEIREKSFKDLLLHFRLSFHFRLCAGLSLFSQFVGADSSLDKAPGNEALKMDTKSQELAFFIRPLEIVKDEASVCTIIGDISL